MAQSPQAMVTAVREPPARLLSAFGPAEALLLQRSIGNRGACAAIAGGRTAVLARKPPRKPPKVDSKTTYTDTSAELFAPSLDNYGGFTGEDLRLEEQAIKDRGQAFDGEARVKMLVPRLMQAEDRRAKASVGGHEVLAVFLAPEWYFKRTPIPYSLEERDKILRSVRTISAGFPHVLIVPGTIIYRDAKKGEIGHMAPVIFRGQLVLEHEKWQNLGDTIGYAREGESDEQASEPFMLEEHGGTAKPGKAKQANIEYGRHRPAPDKKGTSFFQISNVRFSIEVCGDHGRAAQEAAKKQPFPKGANAHVQLLVAHGANPLPGRATVGTGGHQYAVNAAAGDTSETGKSVVQQIGPKPVKTFESLDLRLTGGSATPGDPRLMHGGVHPVT